MRRLIFLLIGFLLLLQGLAQERPIDIIAGFNHQTYEGNYVDYNAGIHQMYLFIFLNPDCPITQKYGIKIKEMSMLEDIIMIGVQPNPGVTLNQITEFKKEYGYDFPILNDEMQSLVRIFDASITPEVFLTDTNGELLYTGAIDNWFVALGKYRKEPTESYLDDAIIQYRNQRKVDVKKTNAIGCLIESHSHMH